eukprot:TRINITY_DN23254_c0_g1_i1.p1 TRINITY_DN23254_c0_g1~~TRINITY_DN23254_c0_g1_i1.p1  ORF type:complete len:398 (+),score=34.36 TRINITY_DN23254_c0_g1_i1:71-1264(+)
MAENDPVTIPAQCLGSTATDAFNVQGFSILSDPVLSDKAVQHLRDRLDAVLAGTYDTGASPDKVPRYQLNALDPHDKRRRHTLHIINIRHADIAFRSLVHSPSLMHLVSRLAGWPGARVVQDQVWAKPPLAGALAFHRDTPYLPFVPSRAITVWISLDDLCGAAKSVPAGCPAPSASAAAPTSPTPADALGPLEYCAGSHTWGSARRGVATQFFAGGDDRRRPLELAADAAGVPAADIHVATVRVRAGGCSVHDGNTWHGSGPNTSPTAFRRGIGIHYVHPAAVFEPLREGAVVGRMWARYRPQPRTDTTTSDACNPPPATSAVGSNAASDVQPAYVPTKDIVPEGTPDRPVSAAPDHEVRQAASADALDDAVFPVLWLDHADMLSSVAAARKHMPS